MIPISSVGGAAVTSVFGPVSANAASGLSGGSFGNDTGFSGVLKSALNQVSSMQDSAAGQVNTLMAGGNGDMSKVMVSVEKADVAFQLMMQVRNKIVNAYQDIEKMQF